MFFKNIFSLTCKHFMSQESAKMCLRISIYCKKALEI